MQIDLEKTQRTFEQAEKNYKLRYQKSLANMQEVNASYTQAERKLQQLQDVLKQFTISAPKAGMVIYKRGWDGAKQGIGATYNAWEGVIAELPNLKEMISKTYVNEIDISKIKTGQVVRIGIDAFPEKKFTGKVTEVANIGEQLQSSNAKVFEVKIVVNEFDSILRPAMTTKNTIVTNVIDNVLFLPIEAIYSNDTITYVFRKDGRKTIRQQVIVGLSNENEIIIKAGLSEKDEILLVQPDKPEEFKLSKLSPDILKKFEEKPVAKKLPVKATADPGKDNIRTLIKNN